MVQINNYPKSKEKFKEFIKRLLTVWATEAAGTGVPEIDDDQLEATLGPVIESNPRILYDFLDENYIYLQPHLAEQLNPEKGWVYELSSPKGLSDESEPKSLRKDIEIEGFNHALKKLEELL